MSEVWCELCEDYVEHSCPEPDCPLRDTEFEAEGGEDEESPQPLNFHVLEEKRGILDDD